MSQLPARNERDLIAAFSAIHDPHERLSAIVSACAGSGIAEGDRREADIVPGCVSRVWLTASLENDSLHLRWDAGSPLVKGLAGLVCRVYEGAAAQQAAAFATSILTELHLDRQLSPTRWHGLANVIRRIRELSAKFAGTARLLP
jgi:cysteine desulfuration protein SufE